MSSVHVHLHILDLEAINAALSLGGESGRARTIDPLGIQVETRARVKAAGLTVREEMRTSCCCSNQDKFWVRDPDGVEWEPYHLNHDLEEEAAAETTTCCTPLARIGRRP